MSTKNIMTTVSIVITLIAIGLYIRWQVPRLTRPHTEYEIEMDNQAALARSHLYNVWQPAQV